MKSNATLFIYIHINLSKYYLSLAGKEQKYGLSAII